MQVTVVAVFVHRVAVSSDIGTLGAKHVYLAC